MYAQFEGMLKEDGLYFNTEPNSLDPRRSKYLIFCNGNDCNTQDTKVN